MLQEDQINKLTRLKELLNAGVLTEEEFTKEKAKIMSGAEQGHTPHTDRPMKNKSLLSIQIICFIVTVVMFVLFYTSYDPVVFGIIGCIAAIATIILSWLKKAHIPKTYSIVSTIVCGFFALLMFFTP